MPISLAGPAPAPSALGSSTTDGSYNGFSWGLYTGDAWLLSQAGIEDLPSFRRTDVARAHDWGWFAGPSYPDSRAITMQWLLRADATGSLDVALRRFLAATAPQTPDVELPLYLFGSTRLVMAKVNKRANPYDRERYAGAPRPTVEFLCTDPRIYDATLSVVQGGQYSASGGAVVPLLFPLTFPETHTGGPLVCVNAGNVPTRPVATIQGPSTNPRLENVSTGEVLSLAIVLGATDVLTLDLDARSVTLNGTASRRSALLPASRWWELAPGTTQVLYTSDTPTTGSVVTLTFRSAWM
jgi:hypothetical protein